MNQPKPELLAPAGSLDQAMAALRQGATAIYAGAKRFSARSHAGNLSLEDFSRLCGEAERHGAAVYGALNTLLLDAELPEALELAWQLWSRGVKALIVQDLGLLRSLGLYGPPLQMHASTQMAVHSASGARVLAENGVSRVVLARELSLAEIERIHAALPELELECFVYGSLCYGVSGLCLASGRILGRSGNRGDCGQICRTWSKQTDQDSPGNWFSMNDLDVSGQLGPLIAAGVKSLKIEGRMKSPQWTAGAVAHFRALLDGQEPGDHRDRARLAFGRQASPGFLGNPKGNGLINPEYSGSLGLALGRIEKISGKKALIRIQNSLAVGDGVLVLRGGQPKQAWAAAVRQIETERGQASWSASAGSRVWVQAESEGKGWQSADLGLELRKITDHAAKLPQVKPESLAVFRQALTVGFALTSGPGAWQAQFTLPDFLQAQFSIPIELSPAVGQGRLSEKLRDSLAQGGDSGFVVSDLPGADSLDGWFMPPSQLKELRRQWHGRVRQAFEDLVSRQVRAISADLAAQAAKPPEQLPFDYPPIPARAALSPVGDLPFVVDFAILETGALASWGKARVLPLCPVWFDDQAAFHAGTDWLARQAKADPGLRIIIGLNNLAQLDWYARWKADPTLGEIIAGGFADYGLNCANGAAEAWLAARIPGLRGCLHWPDSENPKAEFQPPLFISRACFRHQSRGEACLEGGRACGRHFDYELDQGKRRYRVLVRNCITYVF